MTQAYLMEFVILVLVTLFIFIFLLLGTTISLLDELDFEDSPISIINVCQTVRATFIQLFINVIVVCVISRSNIKEPLQVLCIDLILFDFANFL